MVSRLEPRLSQESPVRIFGMDTAGHPINISAWTVDVSQHGARVRGVQDWSAPGETIGIRHGMEKARFKIVWVGAKGSSNQGQIGLSCVDAGKYIWGVAAPQFATASAAATGKLTSSFRLPTEARLPIGLAGAAASTNNRRKDARYKASGGAKVQEIGAAAGQWATLQDLSMGGCYLETSAPLAPATRVEIAVHVGDVQITAKGLVTVCHRLVGMGVKFSEMSLLNRTRLEQVMLTLMQTSCEA